MNRLKHGPMLTLHVAIMTAPCGSTHWLSTASASSALVSPVPSPKRPCRAGKCAPIRENQIPLAPAFYATFGPPSLAPAPRWPSPRPLCRPLHFNLRSCEVDFGLRALYVTTCAKHPQFFITASTYDILTS